MAKTSRIKNKPQGLQQYLMNFQLLDDANGAIRLSCDSGWGKTEGGHSGGWWLRSCQRIPLPASMATIQNNIPTKPVLSKPDMPRPWFILKILHLITTEAFSRQRCIHPKTLSRMPGTWESCLMLCSILSILLKIPLFCGHESQLRNFGHLFFKKACTQKTDRL
jgi:hypothetical protein